MVEVNILNQFKISHRFNSADQFLLACKGLRLFGYFANDGVNQRSVSVIKFNQGYITIY